MSIRTPKRTRTARSRAVCPCCGQHMPRGSRRRAVDFERGLKVIEKIVAQVRRRGPVRREGR
jgi:hypothetical protein